METVTSNVQPRARKARLQRLNRVELVTEALFMHLEKQGQIDRAGLREMMEQIDARDGETDGRARKRGT